VAGEWRDPCFPGWAEGKRPVQPGVWLSTRGRGRGRPRPHMQLVAAFAKDGGGGYAGGGGGDGYGLGGHRERVELGCDSIGGGDDGIGVVETSSGTAVGKGDAVAGNGVVVLVGHDHGEGHGQLRSGSTGLIIAAGDGDVAGGSGNGVLGEDGVLEASGTGSDRHGSGGGGQLQSGTRQAIGVGDHGRRTGNGAFVGGEINGNPGNAVFVRVLGLDDEGIGQGGTGGAGLFRPAVVNDPYGGVGCGSSGGGGRAKAGFGGIGEGQGVGTVMLGKCIDRGGVALGVGDGGGGIERAAGNGAGFEAAVAEIDSNADVGFSGVGVGDLEVDGSERGGNGTRLAAACGKGNEVKQSVSYQTISGADIDPAVGDGLSNKVADGRQGVAPPGGLTRGIELGERNGVKSVKLRAADDPHNSVSVPIGGN